MVDTIKRIDSKVELVGNHYPITFTQPKSFVIRLGRTVFHLGRTVYHIVDTGKKLYLIFRDRVYQIPDLYHSIRSSLTPSVKPSSVVSNHSSDTTDETHVSVEEPRIEIPIPTWKTLFVPPQARTTQPRVCKKPRKETDRMLKISSRHLNPAAKKNHFGQGIPNGSNNCFMASGIQAFRVSPTFRKRIQEAELRQNPVIQELIHIYNILEGKKGEKQRPLTSEEINHFRRTCITAGFTCDSDSVQEDPAHFCQFLLDQVGFRFFDMKHHNEHSLGIPVNQLDNLTTRDNHIVFYPGKTDVTEIQDFIHKFTYIEEIEPHHVLKDLADKGLLTPEIEAKLLAMKKVQEVPVTQTRMLKMDQIPRMMLAYIERLHYDKETQKYVLDTRPIDSEQNIIIPIADLPANFRDTRVRFQPLSYITLQKAITSDATSSVNKESGHYSAFCRHYLDDKPVYAHYNSGNVTVHKDSPTEAKEYIAQNARLVILEFRDFVEIT